MQVAILDDYQDVALTMADWSEVASRAPKDKLAAEAQAALEIEG